MPMDVHFVEIIQKRRFISGAGKKNSLKIELKWIECRVCQRRIEKLSEIFKNTQQLSKAFLSLVFWHLMTKYNEKKIFFVQMNKNKWQGD